MALVRDLSSAQVVFQVDGGDLDQFQVIRYHGTEGLCQLYRFDLDLVSGQAVAPADLIGKSAVLSINTGYGERWFHGLVGHVSLLREVNGQVACRAQLVPTAWLLTHRYNSRIFQNKTVNEIISDVLEKGGLALDRFRFELKKAYEPREYCVQYRETDYVFVSRLMEEEGIWWYFEQDQEGHVLVMADSSDAYRPVEGEPALPFQSATGMNVGEEHVASIHLNQAVRPGAVVVNDFNFENPKLKLLSQADAGRDPGLEFSDYPGEYRSQSEGKDIAQLRVEEFETSRTQVAGRSNCPRLSPARSFELTDHPTALLNRAYLVTAVTHRGKQSVVRTHTGGNGRAGLVDASLQQSLIAAQQSNDAVTRDLAGALLQLISRFQTDDGVPGRLVAQWLYHAGQVSSDMANIASTLGIGPMEGLALEDAFENSLTPNLLDLDAPVYECAFEAIPDDVSYRPPRVTPWPVMRGSQTARVVGPPGEEIHTDEYARVKVQFHWDREGKFDENSSCWIRVSQGTAGGGYGTMFLPRVGHEVIVDFLEGDPDKPLIVGSVYNADHMPPYALPDEKTKSSIKTNSVTGGGTNEIRIDDLKDHEQILIHAEKDFHLRVTHDQVENIENDLHSTVDHDQFEQIGHDKSVYVKGKESYKVDGTLSVTCGSDVVEKFGSNHKHEVQMTYAAKGMSIKLEATTGIELKCGGSSIVLTPAAIFIVGGPLVNINSGSGPPVGPVTASATSPVEPLEADDAEPGSDTTYEGGEPLPPGETPAEMAGHKFKPEETEEEESTWIDLKLVDEEGHPIAGEQYRIVDSKQKVHEGTLDANGEAHVIVPPGKCDITYPKLDNKSWQRTA